MSSDLHRILRRQLRRAGCSEDRPPTAEQWSSLLQAVNRTYASSDEDRYTIERSMELSSREMRELHAKVAAEHARLDGLLGALSEGVLHVGDDCTVRWANPAAKLMLGRGDLVGEPVEEVAPLRREVESTLVPVSLDPGTGSRTVADAMLLTESGHIPVEVTLSRVERDGSVVVGIRDLTEIEKVREDLWQARRETEAAKMAERAKSMFLANMSHELRTPLNAIIGYSEILAEDLAGSGEQGWLDDLGRIEASGRHLLALINDILDLSKIEAGRVDLYTERVSIEPWLRAVVDQIEPVATRNGNRLVVDAEPDVGDGWFDQIRLKQCLLNLLGNAAKFTHEGTITVTARRAGRSLRIAVQDTGIGMSTEQMVAVFDEFNQDEASTTRRYGGTGLGLTLTRRLIELMGGTVDVESALGEGSTFTLELDVGPSGALPTSQRFEPRGSHNNGLTVLVVDDDPAVHDLFGRYLSREGYTVITAGSGPQGLDIAVVHQPDVITLDVMMPEVDGWTVLGQLREDRRTRKIPVVLVTMVQDRQRGFSLGADGYLSKPVSGRQLVETLQHCGLNTSDAPRRILVVDDDPLARRMLRQVLVKASYQVEEAANGLQGLAAARRSPPDAILLDLMMPELDGFGFLREQRRIEEIANVPVFVLTAASLDDFERKYLEERVSQVLEKSPGSEEEVLTQLTRQLGRAVRAEGVLQ